MLATEPPSFQRNLKVESNTWCQKLLRVEETAHWDFPAEHKTDLQVTKALEEAQAQGRTEEASAQDLEATKAKSIAEPEKNEQMQIPPWKCMPTQSAFLGPSNHATAQQPTET